MLALRHVSTRFPVQWNWKCYIPVVVVAETFGERIVVNLQLGDLQIGKQTLHHRNANTWFPPSNPACWWQWQELVFWEGVQNECIGWHSKWTECQQQTMMENRIKIPNTMAYLGKVAYFTPFSATLINALPWSKFLPSHARVKRLRFKSRKYWLQWLAILILFIFSLGSEYYEWAESSSDYIKTLNQVLVDEIDISCIYS